MDVLSVRDNYPALQHLTYLNTASCGIISRQTSEVAQRFYQELMQQGGVPRAGWYEQIPQLRKEIAEWLGAQAEEISLLPNFSIASNFMAQALTGRRRILLLDNDYASLTMPWLLQNYDVHYVSATSNGYFDFDLIEQAVKENDIQMLAISHVQYTTGFCVDLESLGQACRDWGVWLVVDATQSLGVIPIDVRTMPVDILMGSGYKWMTAGFGNALLFVRRELYEQLAVSAVGNNSFDGFPHISSKQDIVFSARTLEVGHVDFSSFFALRQAIRELQTIGAQAIKQRVDELTNYLYRQLPTQVRVVSDYPEAHRSGVTVIEGGLELEKKLLDHKVVTSARARGLRISLHFYNHEADIDHLCEALEAVL